ncbi:MAG: hypothetical protein HY077_16735 [Elusimicrobia bacterium]|nr:hypothetical protein [Elusimicrobiota bacterium]
MRTKAGVADSERRRMSCWLGVAPGPRGGPSRAPRTLAERGEAALLRGDHAAAQADLDAALAKDPKDAWSYAARAALLFQGGRYEEARRDAESFSRLKPASPAGPAMRALLCAREGDRAKTQRWLDEAVARGGAGWARALRGTMLARWGQLDEARADLDAAAAAEPGPWVLAERADVLNRLGFFWLALKDLDRMRALLPGDPEADVRAASIHLDQAQYKDAAARLSRAIGRRPKDPDLYRRRSLVAFVQGRPADCLRDIQKACALAPADPKLRQELIRGLIVCGRDGAAQEAIDSSSLSEAEREFSLGYLRCRQGRFAESRCHFAGAASRPAELVAKASFYALVARSLEAAPRPARPKGQELLIIGLGYRQPFQVTREALAQLVGCELIYSNLSDTAVADFLGLFPIPMRAIVFRRADQDAIKCARDVMPGFDRVRCVAVVTRGHPLYYGRLAYRLANMCRRRGIAVRVPPSVSIADAIPSLAGAERGPAGGLQVRNSDDLEGVDRRLPLVLYNFAARGQWRVELCRRLAGSYPAAHPVTVLAGSGDREFAPNTVPLAKLAPVLSKADEAVTILVPAAR